MQRRTKSLPQGWVSFTVGFVDMLVLWKMRNGALYLIVVYSHLTWRPHHSVARALSPQRRERAPSTQEKKNTILIVVSFSLSLVCTRWLLCIPIWHSALVLHVRSRHSVCVLGAADPTIARPHRKKKKGWLRTIQFFTVDVRAHQNLRQGSSAYRPCARWRLSVGNIRFVRICPLWVRQAVFFQAELGKAVVSCWVFFSFLVLRYCT